MNRYKTLNVEYRIQNHSIGHLISKMEEKEFGNR